jgi:hypothetical protein
VYDYLMAESTTDESVYWLSYEFVALL